MQAKVKTRSARKLLDNLDFFTFSRSPCGGYLASCGCDDSIIVFRSSLPNSKDSSSSGALCNVGGLTVWQSIAKAHKGDVNCVSWHPKIGGLKADSVADRPAYLLASGGDDKLINLWSIDLDPDCLDSFVAMANAPMNIENDDLSVD